MEGMRNKMCSAWTNLTHQEEEDCINKQNNGEHICQEILGWDLWMTQAGVLEPTAPLASPAAHLCSHQGVAFEVHPEKARVDIDSRGSRFNQKYSTEMHSDHSNKPIKKTNKKKIKVVFVIFMLVFEVRLLYISQ